MGCVVSFTAQLLPSWRSPSVPIEKKAGWVPKLVWMFWRRDTFLPLLESNYDFSDVYLVTVSPPPPASVQTRLCTWVQYHWPCPSVALCLGNLSWCVHSLQKSVPLEGTPWIRFFYISNIRHREQKKLILCLSVWSSISDWTFITV